MISTIVLFCLTQDLLGQVKEFNGEYRHEKKGAFYSTFHFDKDKFILIQSGDLGIFYGKGKYQLDKSVLVLSFDTLNLDRTRVGGYAILEPRIDSLILRRMDKRGFEIVYTLDNGVKYFEEYIQKK